MVENSEKAVSSLLTSELREKRLRSIRRGAEPCRPARSSFVYMKHCMRVPFASNAVNPRVELPARAKRAGVTVETSGK